MEKERKGGINTKSGSLLWSIWHYVIGALLVVLGILAIAYNANTDLQKTFLIIIGAFVILDGVIRVALNFIPIFVLKNKSDLVFNFAISGALELAIGITLIVDSGAADAIAALLTYFIAIVLLVAAVILIVFAIAFIKTKLYRLYMPILEIVFAAALAALGIFILIKFNPENSSGFYSIVLIIVGILVIVFGVGEIVFTTLALIGKNKVKKAVEETKQEEAKEVITVDESNVVSTQEGEEKKDAE